MSSGRSAVLVVALSLVARAAPAAAGEPAYARIFAGREGCFALYDLKERKWMVRSDARVCVERVSPCSTFKVPLALMAFDAGLLADESTTLKWDGKAQGREVWNRDHTAASWMRDSVVWFSRRLTPQMGARKVTDYLRRFSFGNADMSGGITQAWIESSLRVSADEQVRFWERLARRELPVSKQALETTWKITFVDTSPAGWTLHGKTGSGYTRGRRLGWFVGHVERGDRAYVFVTRFLDHQRSRDDRPSGWIARDLSKRILGELGLY